MQLVVAVDFTGSNGNPTSSNSLHYLNPSALNTYEQAIFSVGEILLNYDADKLVPMYGFGGKIQGQVRHCFALNFDENNPDVQGLDGML